MPAHCPGDSEFGVLHKWYRLFLRALQVLRLLGLIFLCLCSLMFFFLIWALNCYTAPSNIHSQRPYWYHPTQRCALTYNTSLVSFITTRFSLSSFAQHILLTVVSVTSCLLDPILNARHRLSEILSVHSQSKVCLSLALFFIVCALAPNMIHNQSVELLRSALEICSTHPC